MPEALAEQVRAWEAVLEAMELHVDEIRAGLEVGFLPTPYEVSAPACPMPASLGDRAQQLLADQHDLEDAVRQRMAALSSVLSGAFGPRAAAEPCYVDRRG